MQKVLTATEMREVDRRTTEEYGIPSVILMENAAQAAARTISERLGSVKDRRIIFLCGPGNNGGDGAALARILWTQGADCFVHLLGTVSETKGDARTNFEIVQKISESERTNAPDDNCLFLWEHVPEKASDEIRQWMDSHCDVMVDAVFGTGLSRPLSHPYDEILTAFQRQARRRRCLLISLDIPSGLSSDTADHSGIHIAADVTVSFTAPKVGNVAAPASSVNGELVIADIGSPQELIDSQPSQLFVSERTDVSRWLKSTAFSSASYKNKRGHALLIAGSENYSGAAVLCGNAAIRTGVGLVTIGTARSSKDPIAGRVVPEVMVRPLVETETGSVAEEAFDEIRRFSSNVDAVAIGSGLAANNDSTGRLVRRLVTERTMPTVLDADALTLLSPFDAREIKDENKPPLILTPHQGEFLKMLGAEDADVIEDRVAAVRKFARKHHVILVLKGERSLIAEPGGKVVVNPTGNSGLGKAGNGDTLTGIIAGFAAQAAAMKIDIFETIVAAVYVAGYAGDLAERKFGKRAMIASDVRDCLAEVFHDLERPPA